MDLKASKGIVIGLIALWAQATLALDATGSDAGPMDTLPDGQITVDPVQAPSVDPSPALKKVEIRNNSAVNVLVVQKGLKETLAPKQTLERDMSQYPVSITPADKENSLKYVTAIGKTKNCQQDLCLIVQ
ncbi:hypothetical protein [Pseudomonas sp. MPB23]|uniref:hypothetical protein n=1 Tax=Pseudomonas sp. MPB23 TaxID=3388490 RepID=UPI0039846A76